MIAGMCLNRGIGLNNKLPWHFSEDLRYFSKVTKGSGNNAIIMGKNTELGYSQYFKRGLLNNFSHVTFSLIVSSITSIILFTKLSNSDYILYSVSQITVYFFVNFASLEFGKIIRKFIPNMELKSLFLP